MPSEPVWLTRRFLDAAHADQLKQHGGLAGVRDANVLESALARPKTKWGYEPGISLLELGAAFAYGLATSHPYTDGNKRVAFIAMYTFLGLNDLEISVSQVEAVDVMLRVADGSLSEQDLAHWLEANTIPMEWD